MYALLLLPVLLLLAVAVLSILRYVHVCILQLDVDIKTTVMRQRCAVTVEEAGLLLDMSGFWRVLPEHRRQRIHEIGRASCRERV